MFKIIQALASELQSQMIPFCQKLVQTPSAGGEEGDVARILMAELRRLDYDEVFSDEWGNVVGIIKGDAPGPKIMYNSHMDHVPPGEREKWADFDPFGGVIASLKTAKVDPAEQEDTRVIVGRGVADMKGTVASHVYTGALLKELRKRHGYVMRGDYILSSVVWEEAGEMLGTIKLMDETFKNRGIKVHASVCGEPTSLRLALGHRGRMELSFRVNGLAAHGSAPWRGVNAVNKAVKLIEAFEQTAEAEKKTDPDLGSTGYALCIIGCEPGANCIVPDVCNILYDRRFTPEESPRDMVAQAQRVIDKLAAEDKDFSASAKIKEYEHVTYTGKTIPIQNYKEAFKLDKNHPLARESAAALRALGHDSTFYYWDFGTDAPVTHVRHKIPTIGYSGLQEVYCHTPLERARLDWLEKSLAGNAAIYLKVSALEEEDLKL
ncbi:MAG: M20/M25/M40 family metallo-hydrolase [Desulfovibrio sp.]|jgi:putative selenium metabolism hydrolase|nr:M20/M25/M40 family metallo-hydrolase [Desulfovibrio sp.]